VDWSAGGKWVLESDGGKLSKKRKIRFNTERRMALVRPGSGQ
jgi:hypothetical protein